MSSQANVTLTALNGDVLPPKRSLNLNPARTSVPIGRASSSLSKGLREAVDNAWFHSPVMSRDHAKLIFDPSTRDITIKDIGSMHGTYVNSIQVPMGERRVLQNQDMLVFGTEVRRGNDKYPPCAFQFQYELLPYRASNTYQFPDSSDIDENYDMSDDNSDVDSEGSNGDEVRSKVVQSTNAIELTKDDSSVVSSPVLTNSVNSFIANKVHNLIVENDDADGTYSSDSAGDSGIDASECPTGEDDNISDDGASRLRSHSTSEASGHESDDQSGVSLEEAGDAGIRVLHEERLISESYVAPRMVPPKGSYKQDGSYSTVDQHAGTGTAGQAETPWSLGTAHRNFATSAPDWLYGSEMGHKHSGLVIPTTVSDKSMANTFSMPREPSPSDAAMVKATVSDVSQKPLHMNECLDNDPNPVHAPCPSKQPLPHAESLGEKTGKHVFFAARECNKVRVRTLASDLLSQTSPLWENQQQEFNSSMSQDEAFSAPVERKTSIKWDTSLPSKWDNSLPNTRSANDLFSQGSHQQFSYNSSIDIGSDFVGQPDTTQLSSLFFDNCRQPEEFGYFTTSQELDMTSAAKYNESKASMVAAALKPNTSAPARPGLSINDIIDDSAHITAKDLKRKADEISDDIEMGVRIWASSSINASEDPASTDILGSGENRVQSANGNCGPVDGGLDHRPAKKMKKFVEAVGYVALGGAAVGATMFSLLVATAPDFL